MPARIAGASGLLDVTHYPSANASPRARSNAAERAARKAEAFANPPPPCAPPGWPRPSVADVVSISPEAQRANSNGRQHTRARASSPPDARPDTFARSVPPPPSARPGSAPPAPYVRGDSGPPRAHSARADSFDDASSTSPAHSPPTNAPAAHARAVGRQRARAPRSESGDTSPRAEGAPSSYGPASRQRAEAGPRAEVDRPGGPWGRKPGVEPSPQTADVTAGPRPVEPGEAPACGGACGRACGTGGGCACGAPSATRGPAVRPPLAKDVARPALEQAAKPAPEQAAGPAFERAARPAPERAARPAHERDSTEAPRRTGDSEGAGREPSARERPRHEFEGEQVTAADARNVSPRELAALRRRAKAESKEGHCERKPPSVPPPSVYVEVAAGRPQLWVPEKFDVNAELIRGIRRVKWNVGHARRGALVAAGERAAGRDVDAAADRSARAKDAAADGRAAGVGDANGAAPGRRPNETP